MRPRTSSLNHYFKWLSKELWILLGRFLPMVGKWLWVFLDSFLHISLLNSYLNGWKMALGPPGRFPSNFLFYFTWKMTGNLASGPPGQFPTHFLCEFLFHMFG